jgi:hypothetical protein
MSSGVNGNFRRSTPSISSRMASDHGEADFARAREGEELERLAAPEVEARDDDVRICRDPEPLPPVLAADLGDQAIHVPL